jgi:uncharacterized protein YcfJ
MGHGVGLGATVGAAIGDTVGVAVGAAVGTAVGAVIGKTVAAAGARYGMHTPNALVVQPAPIRCASSLDICVKSSRAMARAASFSAASSHLSAMVLTCAATTKGISAGVRHAFTGEGAA